MTATTQNNIGEQLVITFGYIHIPEDFPRKILDAYNKDKHAGEKRGWFSYIDDVWKKYKLDTDPRWKSLYDFRIEMSRLCKIIQPPKRKVNEEEKFIVYDNWSEFPIILTNRKPGKMPKN